MAKFFGLILLAQIVFVWSASSRSGNFSIQEENSRNKENYESVARHSPLRSCHKAASCEKLRYSTCMGVKLPYSSTSLDSFGNVQSQEEAQKKLQKWRGLIHIPRCWSVIQPFLCALYMPKCEDGFVELPSKEMCESIQSACRLLRTDDMWPEEFKCDGFYESGCVNEVRDLKFNSTGECKAPLVRAVDESSFYEGVEGCGVQCNDPYFIEPEREQIKEMIKWLSIISCLLNVFAVLTFVINDPFGNKYPGHAVFWMSCCFLMVGLGFMFQFFSSNESTICHADGTLRTSEPSRENLSCIANFIFIYYFLMKGMIWLVIFAFTMLLNFQEATRTRKNEWTAYYNMAAWSIPLILTVTILALQQVDGDGLLGICFVGVVNKDMRLIFVLGPLSVSVVSSTVLLGWSIIKFNRLKSLSDEIISSRAKKEVQKNIYKLSVFLVAIVVCTCTLFYCQIYDWRHYSSWKKSFRSFIVCRLGVVGDVEIENCRMRDRPNFSLVQLRLLSLFVIHISVVALWVFTSYSTIETWKRFLLKRVFRREAEENGKLKKHIIIRRAFQKRKCLNKDGLNSEGMLSIDLCKSYQDPVGLDFELNSVGSCEDTSFVKTVPQLMIRRDAIKPESYSNSGQWKNASDSEISYSYTRIHVESRRNSSGSNMSIQYETVTKGPCRKKRRDRKKKRCMKSCSPEIIAKKNKNLFMEHNLDKEVFAAISGKTVHGPHANRTRRMAITNIEEDISKLLNIGLRVENETNDILSPTYDGLLFAGQTFNSSSEDGSVSSEESE